MGLAEVLYERNELTAALDHATRGVTLCRQLAFTPPLATGLAVVARIRQAHGDAAGALEAMGEAGQAGLSPQVVALFNPVPSQRARLLLAQGDVPAAAQWATAAGLSPDDEPDYPREPAYLVLARVLLAQNDPGPALTLLQRLLDAAASQGRAGSIIEIQALRALALAARGDHASALGALTEALTLARRHGYVRVFADEGAPMHALLAQLAAARPGQQHAAHRIDPGYLAALLRACGQADAVPPRRRAAGATGPGRAADRPRTGGAAAARRGQVKPAHRPRPGGGARHGQKARDPRPGQARRRQPHRGRRAGPAARPDPLTPHLHAARQAPSGDALLTPYAGGNPGPGHAVPKPRTISKALLTHPDRLTEDDAQIVKNAAAGCAHLERLQLHVRSFAKMMAQRRGQELPAWLEAVEADDLPELRSFAAGMRRDLSAVINGLTLEHSSGAVEGNVTRIKRIKRDGYGRANFDLLRAQILIAA